MDRSSPALDALARAREQTQAAGSARIELVTDCSWTLPPRARRRRGGLLRPVGRVARAAGLRLLAAATHTSSFPCLVAEGVLDLARRRYMLDYGGFAVLFADGQLRSGRSGEPLPAATTDATLIPAPLWLLDVLAGATSAVDEGVEDVAGRRCRHVLSTVDMHRASQATPGPLALPAGLRSFEDLLALPVEAWLDDGGLRRVRFSTTRASGGDDRPGMTETLELRELGVQVDDLDWTRLPALTRPPPPRPARRGRGARSANRRPRRPRRA